MDVTVASSPAPPAITATVNPLAWWRTFLDGNPKTRARVHSPRNGCARGFRCSGAVTPGAAGGTRHTKGIYFGLLTSPNITRAGIVCERRVLDISIAWMEPVPGHIVGEPRGVSVRPWGRMSFIVWVVAPRTGAPCGVAAPRPAGKTAAETAIDATRAIIRHTRRSVAVSFFLSVSTAGECIWKVSSPFPHVQKES